MTDIVERLRGYASDDHERGCQGRYYTCSCGYDEQRDPLLVEAADEITRLRAALEKIAAYTLKDNCECSACEHAVIARAALQQEPKP